MGKKTKNICEENIDRIIEMAWEDRTPFEAIYEQFQIQEKELLSIMRQHLSIQSFKRWRKRVKGRTTKHQTRSPVEDKRFVCKTQYKHKSKQKP